MWVVILLIYLTHFFSFPLFSSFLFSLHLPPSPLLFQWSMSPGFLSPWVELQWSITSLTASAITFPLLTLLQTVFLHFGVITVSGKGRELSIHRWSFYPSLSLWPKRSEKLHFCWSFLPCCCWAGRDISLLQLTDLVSLPATQQTRPHLRAFALLNPSVWQGFPGGSEGQESAGIAGDLGLISGLGRSPGGGHGNPFQYSCLEYPQGQRVWHTTVLGVTKSHTQLSD